MTRRSRFRLAIGLLALALAGAALPAAAEQSSRGGVFVGFSGSFAPDQIPRHRLVPISLTLSGAAWTNDGPPPRLRRIELAFGARGGLDTAGLPVCPRSRLRNATQRQALARCRTALVGRGEIAAEVPFSQTAPYRTRASVLVFNGLSGCSTSPRPRTQRVARADPQATSGPGRLWPSRSRTQGGRQGERTLAVRDPLATDRGRRDAQCHRRPAAWVQAYAASPPVSFVLPFYLQRPRKGTYGVIMRSLIGRSLGPWPRLRSFQITLGRRYMVAGEQRSYLSAHCPLAPRYTHLSIPFARATYEFGSGPTFTEPIRRSCTVQE